MEQEGVIKYQLDFETDQCSPAPNELENLNDVRSGLITRGMLGQDPNRYEGYGFGNLSFRDKKGCTSFWVSGSQTGHLAKLGRSGVSLVTQCDASLNRLVARGGIEPSSESLTHGVLYQLSPKINAVIHVHCPLIWNNASRLGLASTPSEISYGTPEMANSVYTLSSELMNLNTTTPNTPIVFVMYGHEDGVVAAGCSLGDCYEALCKLQSKCT